MGQPIRDLATLLSDTQPRLRDGAFGYCCVPPGASVPPGLTPVLTFIEEEGTTLVLPIEQARAHRLEPLVVARMITLGVASALDAVGFLAAVSARLAAAGISVNAVSACHHDHLFVPSDRAEDAMRLLSGMAG